MVGIALSKEEIVISNLLRYNFGLGQYGEGVIIRKKLLLFLSELWHIGPEVGKHRYRIFPAVVRGQSRLGLRNVNSLLILNMPERRNFSW